MRRKRTIEKKYDAERHNKMYELFKHAAKGDVIKR